MYFLVWNVEGFGFLYAMHGFGVLVALGAE